MFWKVITQVGTIVEVLALLGAYLRAMEDGMVTERELDRLKEKAVPLLIKFGLIQKDR